MVFRALWERHGRAAGVIRNQAMLDYGIDLVLAFPGGRGTADMVRRARSAGVAVAAVAPAPKSDRFVRVVGPHFVAGAIWRDGRCIHAAPILHHLMMGRSGAEVRRILESRGWHYGSTPIDRAGR